MNILLCGADGFLGRAIAAALEAAGHRVLRGVHHPRLAGDVVIDYQTDLSPEAWLPRLAGVDVVINAIGILREPQPGDFERIHHRAPAALFAACAAAGVGRVIQISALGGEFQGEPPHYLASKHAADRVLWQSLPERGVVLRPGLVFGRDGASTRFFLALASLPLHADPAGAGAVQPVHVDDVAAAVLRLVEGAAVPSGLLELPGPRRLSYAGWLASYRSGLGLPPALSLPLPGFLMAATARLAGLFPASLLTADTWAMLKAGNTADPGPARSLLGRPLKAPADFIVPDDTEALRLQALAAWRRPLLRAVLAAIWLLTALLSFGVYPLENSLALLAPFGISGAAALALLYGASLLDLAMAALTVWRPGRRLWLAQLALVGGYTALIAWKLPEFLLHPFGPVLKNLAVAALLFILYAEEDKS